MLSTVNILMSVHFDNLKRVLTDREPVLGLPNGIYLGLLALGFAASVYFTIAFSSLERSIEAYSNAEVITLCGDYEDNLQLAKDMGYLEVAENMEEICGNTIDKMLDSQ